jgi:predicted ATPase
LLVLEDLHWASESMLQLLHYLARRLAAHAVMVVGTWRPEAVATTHPLPALQRQLARDGLAQPLPLPRLPRPAVERMIAEMSGAGGAVQTLAQRLYQETEGNPFFLMEIVKALFETDVICLEGGTWQGDFAAISEGQLPLPVGVREAIVARVERLDENARDALRLASVIGCEFNFDLLGGVWGRGEEATLEALDELLRRRLIAEGVDRGDSDFTFTHHLIREVVYATLPRRRRLHWHARVGEGIERLYADELPANVGELAYHFAQAAELDRSLSNKAVTYLLQAGKQAERQPAHREAIAYYRRGLVLLQRLPPTRQRRQQELALQVALATPVTALKGYAAGETKRVYSRASELCRQLGEAPALFTALAGLSRHHGVSGNVEAAQELAEQVVAIAEDRGDPTLRIEAYRILAGPLFMAGQLVEARALWRRGLALYEARRHEQYACRFGHDPATTCLGYLTMTSWMLGRLDEARAHGERLCELMAAMTHASSLAYGHCLLALHACLSRNLDEAATHAARAIRLGERHRLPAWSSMATALQGWVQTVRCLAQEDLVDLHTGIKTWRSKGFEHLAPLLLTLEAEACLKVEALEEADAAISAARALTQGGTDRFWTPEVCRLRGELLWARAGAGDEVEGSLREALAGARRAKLLMLELRAAMSLVRWQFAQGDAEAGQRLLGEVYGRFDEGLDAPDLRKACELLRRVSSAVVGA